MNVYSEDRGKDLCTLVRKQHTHRLPGIAPTIFIQLLHLLKSA